LALLLADSGSTKTSWKLVDSSGKASRIQTSGMNPNYLTEKEIENILREELIEKVDVPITSIRFYGSGCSQSQAKEKLKQVFFRLYPKASVDIDTDLVGACKSVISQQTSWVCILGTGSNACVVKEGEIIYQPLSLGYILGDEGSGQDIGKRLLKAYFSDSMPLSLKKKWEDEYNLSYSELINKVYQTPKANTWMATFSIFAKNHMEEPFIESLVLASFESFVNTYIISQKEYQNLPVHFVGSIAFHFEIQIRKVLQKHQLKVGQIIQSPIEKWK